MTCLDPLHHLARELGVHTRYRDGLGREVIPNPETLMQIISALGVPIDDPGQAGEACRQLRHARATTTVPPVVVAWDGTLPPVPLDRPATLRLEDGGTMPLTPGDGARQAATPLPLGRHRLTVEGDGRLTEATVIAAPIQAWRPPPPRRGWGVAAHLAALRSARSRSVGDLGDLETLCRWVGRQGGDLVSLLPLLPTFNTAPAEPSPYSPVSRLFWSELILDLGEAHRATPVPHRLDVEGAHREVALALAGAAVPEAAWGEADLVRYAGFRGAQARLGRNWRAWPEAARRGRLTADEVDGEVERFHLVAQWRLREQLGTLRERADRLGVRIGLDLAVGVHPDGYDPWANQGLFASGIAVGAPPDPGFPSGQDWGFAPVLPDASRREGHRYLAACLAHQMALAGVLRLDHVMALSRLYWIPAGMALDEGSYVSYPMEELLATVTLASWRHRTELVGENLGTVPPEIDAALPRHRLAAMHVAELVALGDGEIPPPGGDEVAMIATHDMPTLAGWLAELDIDERLRYRLLATDREAAAREERRRAVERLGAHLGAPPGDPPALLEAVLAWMGRSASPLVLPWLEDLWLERRGVNLPGTRTDQAPNWQRPMARLLDEVVEDPLVAARLRHLHEARTRVD